MLYLSLDIDRTLVHACPTRFVKPEWLTHFKSFIYEEYTVFVRPYLQEFLTYLETIQDKVKIGLFTAGSIHYKNFIIEELFEDKVKLDFTFSANDYDNAFDLYGTRKPMQYVANKLNTDVKNILMVDDSNAIFRDNSIFANNFYLISKFVVCDDFKHNFFDQILQDRALLDLIQWVQVKIDFVV
jgi:hypothetical protein